MRRARSGRIGAKLMALILSVTFIVLLITSVMSYTTLSKANVLAESYVALAQEGASDQAKGSDQGEEAGNVNEAQASGQAEQSEQAKQDERAEKAQPERAEAGERGTSEAGGSPGVVLTMSEIERLLDVLAKLYSKRSYKLAVLKLSSKYKDVKIITNFDNFYSELKGIFEKHSDVIEEAGYDLDTFSSEVEALYKGLIVAQMEEQFNDPKFKERVRKLEEMLRSPDFPKSKRRYVEEALKKIDDIRQAVQNLKVSVNPKTLEVITQNMSAIKSRMSYAK